MAYPAKFYNVLRHCSIRKINFPSIISRNISLCKLNWGKSYNKYEIREAKFMKKIMGGKHVGKMLIQSRQFQKPPFSTGGQNQRRIAVLNNVFMRHISEMMATGELSSVIVGRGLEISRVKMAPDFNRINVFWLARGSENDAEIQEILEKYSWKLRHELSQLRVIGIVPPVCFIKDKEYSKSAEVNRLLATADYGEDYVPLDVGHCFKSEFAQTAQLLPQMSNMEQLQKEGTEEIAERPLPPMRNDVLGLNHANIMAKIKMRMKKAKALHRQDNIASNTETEEAYDKPEESYANINLKREEFTRFLMKQQIQRKKMSQEKKNYTPEMEMYETEVLENSKIATQFMENIDKDKDYIEEIEDRRM